ncbi:MAG: LEPR-XLL domain-containing protein [Betaproteobacteria bacterium]|nr:LEPR-XLL domain-containing protein [Betaproteobacteria bacterium]
MPPGIPFRRRAVFETLEPRLLLSATPTLLGTILDDNDVSGNPAIYGTLGNDIIDGLAGDDAIYADGGGGSGAGGGDDILVGGNGRDYLDGEDGDDWLEPGPMDPPVTANQTVRGGDGTDTLFLRGAPTDYDFFDYSGGFIANAIGSNAPEGQVAAFEVERVAFGVPCWTTPTARRRRSPSSTWRNWCRGSPGTAPPSPWPTRSPADAVRARS